MRNFIQLNISALCKINEAMLFVFGIYIGPTRHTTYCLVIESGRLDSHDSYTMQHIYITYTNS